MANMKDMTKASSRIYVGNLSENIDSDALYEHFKSYGTILGIKRPMKKCYAFVQFETDESALEAIKNEDQKPFHGRNFIVRAAVSGHNSGNKQKDTSQDDESVGTQSTHLSGDASFTERGDRGSQQRTYRPDGRYSGARSHSGYRDRSPLADDWQDRSTYDRYGTDSYQYGMPDRNDCEIIAVSKQLTEYAEYVEERLKQIGLTVDLLFPNADVPIGRVLGNILSRGSLYAILVMPQNEEHRSLTLNILHGLPQEHRNMPLEDAITLIGRNFSELQRCGTTAGTEAINALLNQLANGRDLTITQYDRLLEYIKECRDKQAKVEGDPKSETQDKTQVDLQQRIMSILNNENKVSDTSKTTTQPQPLLEQNKTDAEGYDSNAAILREKIASMLNSSTGAQGPAPQPVAAPNLKATISNPIIQKALDTLIHKMN